MQKQFFYNQLRSKKGMTLVEVLVYISMLVMLLGVITQSVLMLSTHYRAVRNTRDLEDSAINVMDRLVREARNATDVLPIAVGSFATTTFITTDTVTEQSTTTSFYVVDDTLRISENGIDLGPLTKESVKVTGFDVTIIQNSNSKAIKIELSLVSDEATPAVIAKVFYNSVVIRGSYQ